MKPPWYDYVSPDSVRDSSIREEKKFLAGEDTSMGLWSRMKGALLYAADTEKSQDTRRSSVILAANCAFLMARTTGQLESWMPLSLTKSMNDPLNYSVEMSWLQTAVAQGSPAFAERMLQLLKTAASKPQHDTRLDPIVKQFDYFMDLYRLEPDAASVAALKKKIMVSPMENDRAQIIAPTMTFLLNHGMKKEAADWRQAALAAVAKDKTDVQNVTKALDNIEKQSSQWRPIHMALSEILWKYVDQSNVRKPREVDEILNQSNVGFEYSPETLRNIYFYYIKKGGLFWQPSHWHRLISDALPNDEKWLPLKRELCAKAIAIAPNDEIRVSFASRYPHYFPLFEEENREQLKSWVAPYRDMKANPIMGHVARWADLNIAFAVMDEAAMKTLSEIPQDTADPIDRHWRTVAALTGRNQAKDVEGMLKNLPDTVFAPYTHQGTMLRALKLIDDQKRLTKVTKDARNNAKALVARVWVNRDLDQLPFLIDLVDALDDKELLPEAFIREMRSHPYLPISAPASAWFYTINKSWTDVKTAAEIALKTQAGDTFYWPQMNLLLGFAEANLGHKPEAAAALEKFLKQDPSSIHYHNAKMLLEQVKQ